MVWIYSVSLTAGVWGWEAAAAVFPGLLAVVPFLDGKLRRRFIWAWTLSALCFCYGFLFAFSSHRDIDRIRALNVGRLTLAGRVTGYPEYRLGGVRFPFETTVSGRRTTLLVSTVAFGLGYGDSLSIAGTSSAGREDRSGYLVSRGAAGYLRARARDVRRLASGSAGSMLRRRAGRAHESVRRSLARNLGSRCGLPTALAVGERGWIGKRTKEHFTRLGISHLLALSGMHMGLIAGLLVLALRTARIRNRVALLVPLTLYVLVVGEVVSLFRAYAMAVVLVLAVTVERPARLLDALGTALFVLLLARPGMAYSVAFQLSFAATLAVVLCVTRIPLPVRAGWWGRVGATALSTLVVGASVQLFLLPIQLMYFGRVSLTTPVATLVFLPVTAAVMVATGAALVVDWLAPGPSPWAFAVLGALAHGFERALAVTASWTPGTVDLPKPNVVLYYMGQAVLWLNLLPESNALRRNRLAWITARAATAAVLCFVAFVPFHRFF
jgi:competence protein ComEC